MFYKVYGKIHLEENCDIGISFPEFDGCISAASNQDEILPMAREAIELHISGNIKMIKVNHYSLDQIYMELRKCWHKCLGVNANTD